MRKLSIERAVSVSLLALVVVLLGAGVAMSGGIGGLNPSNNRKQAVESRNDSFNAAKALYPDPKLSNYPLRKTLIDMTQREDLLHHPWYVYVLGDNGNMLGYYVAKAVPINACDFLSSTEDVYNGVVKMQSPSYDGIYYGNTDCNVWVFEDAATNAVIKLGGIKFYVADQPLKIEAAAIKVEAKP